MLEHVAVFVFFFKFIELTQVNVLESEQRVLLVDHSIRLFAMLEVLLAEDGVLGL